MKISMLSGGDATPHYVIALLSGLVSLGIKIDCIGGDSIKDAEVLNNNNISFYNFRGDQNPNVTIKEKIFRKKEVGHSGGWPGVHTLMLYRPQDKIGIIIFTNSYDSTQFTGPVADISFSLIKNSLFRMAKRLA